MYRFKAAPVKEAFLGVETDKPIPTFIWQHKEPWLSKAVLKNKKVKGFTLPNLKVCCKSTVC